MTETVSITTLRASLSLFLERVESGEEFLITRVGKPLALLVPCTQQKSRPPKIEALIRSGQIRPGRGSLPEEFWDEPIPDDPEGLVLKALLEERESGW